MLGAMYTNMLSQMFLEFKYEMFLALACLFQLDLYYW